MKRSTWPYGVIAAYLVTLPLLSILDNVWLSVYMSVSMAAMLLLIYYQERMIILERRKVEEENSRAYEVMMQIRAASIRTGISRLCGGISVCEVCAQDASACPECIGQERFVPHHDKICKACGKCDGQNHGCF